MGEMAVQPTMGLTLNDSAKVKDICNILQQFIRENKLSQNIQGKEFVNVEGWQYAGTQLGIVPVVEDVTDISTETEIKYQAKVNLISLASGMKVGAGVAVCSNKEAGKKFYQEYAIASMAQTRAVGKAYRTVLSWMLKAAGFEPTPAEEMDFQDDKLCFEKNTIEKMIKGSKSMDDLKMITETYPDFRTARKLIKQFDDKLKEITPEEPVKA